jgi:hypothetical protein
MGRRNRDREIVNVTDEINKLLDEIHDSVDALKSLLNDASPDARSGRDGVPHG